MARYKSDDISLLLPTFQPIARELIVRMGELGHEAVPFDTARSLEEAVRNAAKGTGVLNSIHLWGCAVDYICAKHGWQCGAKRCKFFTVLGREAKALGLIWGGDWARGDLPHCQVIPVAWQPRMRAYAISASTVEARDALVQKYRATLAAPAKAPKAGAPKPPR